MVFSALLQRLKAAVQTLRSRAAPKRKHSIGDTALNDVLDLLERNAWLTGGMLDELRETSRVVEGSPLHRSSQVDLAELVRSTAESFLPVAREEGVGLLVKCAASSIVISADAKDLTQIVGRLMACAIRSSERGGRIVCQLTLAPDWIHLFVRVEAGTGAAPGAHTDFDTSAWKQCGLAAVRKLVDLHGGVLRVGFEAGSSGPMFTVMLPGDQAHHRQ